jgi:hypothetical protein
LRDKIALTVMAIPSTARVEYLYVPRPVAARLT